MQCLSVDMCSTSAEQAGRYVYINLSRLPSHVNATYQATAGPKKRRIKKLYNPVYSLKRQQKPQPNKPNQ